MTSLETTVTLQIKNLHKKIKFAGERLGLDLGRKRARIEFAAFHHTINPSDWREIMDGKTDAKFFLSQSLEMAIALDTFPIEDKIPLLGMAFYLVGLTVGVTGDDRTHKACPACIALNYASALGKHGANATHDKPGGTREKRAKIIDIWSSGKYSSRDICAEQECASLGMSFSTARKALRGTPAPS